MNPRSLSLLLVVLSLFAISDVHAGKPLPPQRQPQARRDANLALLQFQNALAADRWSEALALCSTEVQNRAKGWSTAEQFLKDTMPIEHVLARDFNCWSCGDSFYGMFETISSFDEQPRIDWYWGISFSPDGKWLVDYPPVRLPAYMEQRKALRQAHDNKIAALQRSLDAKAGFVSTRLVPLTNRFALGQPMRFRVELTNAGPTSVYYLDGGLRHYGLVVHDERRGMVVTNTTAPAQIQVSKRELPARSAVTLAETMDITVNHQINEPGTYKVQFDGRNLDVGESVPREETDRMDRFGRPLLIGTFGLFTGTNKFPSNVVKINVRR